MKNKRKLTQEEYDALYERSEKTGASLQKLIEFYLEDRSLHGIEKYFKKGDALSIEGNLYKLIDIIDGIIFIVRLYDDVYSDRPLKLNKEYRSFSLLHTDVKHVDSSYIDYMISTIWINYFT